VSQLRAQGAALRVVTLNSPTTYYLGTNGPEGFEYRLLASFAAKLGLSLQVQTVPDIATLRAALADGSADLAAAQITADREWRRVGLVCTTYGEIPQLVIEARGKPHPRNIAGLRHARLVVRAGSPQLDLLRSIQSNGVPDLSWTEVPLNAADPLDWVNSGDADFAIVDGNIFAFARHLFPEVNVAFALPDPRPVQWVVRRGALDLSNAVARFFADVRRSGELDQIEQAANAEAGDFEYEEAHRFQADIAKRLPELQPLFEEAAQASGLDWRLLAAVGYQESHWESGATSANGAAGIMMLTSDTADTMGVKNRSDARQSILGGAKYLAQVIATIPDRIPEPDRTWLGLAAYNVGYGHLEDARVLAQMRGKNPDSWDDVRAQLPLLTEEEWYTRVKRGYARGWEPAKFVEQVRQYLAVLEWIDAGTLARRLRPGTPSS
jgi:membrane-bound lytic murein transglycosylase F